jgi:hypothetical protein
MKKAIKNMVVGDQFVINNSKERYVIDYICDRYIIIISIKNTNNIAVYTEKGPNCYNSEFEMVEPEPEWLYEYAYMNEGKRWFTSNRFETESHLKSTYLDYRLLRKFNPETMEEVKDEQ